MKKITILPVFLFSFFLIATAQTPNWLWADGTGGNLEDKGTSIATDPQGNVIVTGYFLSSNIQFGTQTLNNEFAGFFDVFLAKYDSLGNVIWAQSAGGAGNDQGLGVATDQQGNIFITGSYTSTTIEFDTITLGNSGNNDIFIAKYSPAGNVIWVKKAGGNTGDIGNSVSADSSGNVVIVGQFDSNVLTFGTHTINNGGSTDIFLAKYDAAGNALWAKRGGGGQFDVGTGVSTDTYGNVCITGAYFSTSVNFDSFAMSNPGGYGIFIVKYDSNGNALWAKNPGGTDTDWGSSITTDWKDNIYVTGWFYSTSVAFGSVTLNTAGYADIFVVKYNSAGVVQWAKNAGGISGDGGTGIAVDGGLNVFVTGYFDSPSFVYGTDTLVNAGGSGTWDSFTSKYDSLGNVVFAKREGTIYNDEGLSITTDNRGNVCETGFYYGTSITIGSDVLTCAGEYDIFVARMEGVYVYHPPITHEGISDMDPSPGISVFPNPASNSVYVYLSNPNIRKLELYNILGELVVSLPVDIGTPNYPNYSSDYNRKTINLTNQPSGIYFIRGITDEKIISQKIVKL